MITDFHYASLLDVAYQIRLRNISSTQVTRALLDRSERLDPALSSFLQVLPEQALAAAGVADREIAAGLYRGPLHGIPIGLKDLLYMKDLPVTAGMPLHKDFRTTYDATVVEKLKTAGAVIIGRLNLTEGATLEHHPDMPRPDNPWSKGHWTGVSSSGSGVATAAGFCYGALGTDTGGSIRMPSACCGLSGIKPTWGRVSRYGLFPLIESLDHIGPMARTTADAAAILRVIAGADTRDPTSLQAPVADYLSKLDSGVSDLVIGVDWAYATDDVQPAVAKAFTDAIAVLESLGARIVPVVVPPVPTMECMPLQLAGVAAAHESTFPSSAEFYSPALRAMLEGVGHITGAMVAQAYMAQLRFSGALTALFERIDVLATPSLPCAAPTWDEIAALLEDMPSMISGLMRYTVPFNLSGNPTLSIPCGFDGGLPLSLQLIGRKLEESILCRTGHSYQCATNFHTRHPSLDVD